MRRIQRIERLEKELGIEENKGYEIFDFNNQINNFETKSKIIFSLKKEINDINKKMNYIINNFESKTLTVLEQKILCLYKRINDVLENQELISMNLQAEKSELMKLSIHILLICNFLQIEIVKEEAKTIVKLINKTKKNKI